MKKALGDVGGVFEGAVGIIDGWVDIIDTQGD